VGCGSTHAADVLHLSMGRESGLSWGELGQGQSAGGSGGARQGTGRVDGEGVNIAAAARRDGNGRSSQPLGLRALRTGREDGRRLDRSRGS
jgi:hypothetical protein